MNQLTTFRWAFDEDVHYYRQAGYGAMGVWRRKLSDFGEERAAELLIDNGMRVSNLLWAGGFTGNDGRTLEENLDDAKSAIKTAAMLRAGCLVVYTGGRNNHTERHADRLVRGVLDELLPVAVDCGVTLAVEPMHPACCAEWTILTSLEATADLLDDYRSPRLKMVYDAYHFPLRGEDLAHLGEITPSIAVVHLGDSLAPHSIDQERCPLGEGRMPLGEIITCLLESGYSGDFDVELMGAAVEACDYRTLLSDSREFFSRAQQASGVLGG